MYCSSCGGGVLQGLTYCNHCGSKLNSAKRDEIAKTQEQNTESLIWAIVAVFVGGLAIIIGLLSVMKNVLNFHTGLLIFFAMLCFFMMTVIEAVFIWKFLGQKSSTERSEPAQLEARPGVELGGIQARTLAEPLTSVTDQTTRSFEPILTKRTSE